MKWQILVGVVFLIFICMLPASASIENDIIESVSSTTSTVIQDETKYFSQPVLLGSTEIDIRLSWKLPPDYNSLVLQIFSPDGLAITEFTDTYESPVSNGVIPVTVMIPENAKAGDWIFSVIGREVTGIQPFTIQGHVFSGDESLPIEKGTKIYSVTYEDTGFFAPQITAWMYAWFTYDGVHAPDAHLTSLKGVTADNEYTFTTYYTVNTDDKNGLTTIIGVVTARSVDNPEEGIVYTLKIFCTKDGEMSSQQMKGTVSFS